MKKIISLFVVFSFLFSVLPKVHVKALDSSSLTANANITNIVFNQQTGNIDFTFTQTNNIPNDGSYYYMGFESSLNANSGTYPSFAFLRTSKLLKTFNGTSTETLSLSLSDGIAPENVKSIPSQKQRLNLRVDGFTPAGNSVGVPNLTLKSTKLNYTFPATVNFYGMNIRFTTDSSGYVYINVDNSANYSSTTLYDTFALSQLPFYNTDVLDITNIELSKDYPNYLAIDYDLSIPSSFYEGSYMISFAIPIRQNATNCVNCAAMLYSISDNFIIKNSDFGKIVSSTAYIALTEDMITDYYRSNPQSLANGNYKLYSVVNATINNEIKQNFESVVYNQTLNQTYDDGTYKYIFKNNVDHNVVMNFTNRKASATAPLNIEFDPNNIQLSNLRFIEAENPLNYFEGIAFDVNQKIPGRVSNSSYDNGFNFGTAANGKLQIDFTKLLTNTELKDTFIYFNYRYDMYKVKYNGPTYTFKYNDLVGIVNEDSVYTSTDTLTSDYEITFYSEGGYLKYKIENPKVSIDYIKEEGSYNISINWPRLFQETPNLYSNYGTTVDISVDNGITWDVAYDVDYTQSLDSIESFYEYFTSSLILNSEDLDVDTFQLRVRTKKADGTYNTPIVDTTLTIPLNEQRVLVGQEYSIASDANGVLSLYKKSVDPSMYNYDFQDIIIGQRFNNPITVSSLSNSTPTTDSFTRVNLLEFQGIYRYVEVKQLLDLNSPVVSMIFDSGVLFVATDNNKLTIIDYKTNNILSEVQYNQTITNLVLNGTQLTLQFADSTTQNVTVANYFPYVTVPNFANQSLATVKQWATEQNIVLEETTVYSPTISAGKIVSQNLTGSNVLRIRGSLKIQVSLGKTPYALKTTTNVTLSNNASTNQSVVFSSSIISSLKKSVTLNGTTMTWPTNNTFANPGVYKVTITSNYTETFTFTIDKTAPKLTVKDSSSVTLSTNAIVNKDVTVTTNEGTLTVTKNGATTTWPTGGKFISDGKYVVTAKDVAGNSSPFTFTIDKTAPTIKGTEITSKSVISNGGYANESVIVSISDLSTYTKTVTRNGYSYSWPSNSTFTSEGKYVVTAKDKFGKISTYTFIIDKTKPTLSIKTTGGTTLSNNSYSKYSVIVSYKDTYYSSKTVTRNGSTYAWPSTNTFTSEGKYVITVKDKAGNVNTITFTIDKTKPSVSIKTTGGTTLANYSYTKYSLVLSYKDTNYYSKSVTRNGSTYTWPSSNTFTSDGKYIVTIKDKAGNVNTVTFTIDKTKPTLSIKTTGGTTLTNNSYSKYSVIVSYKDTYYSSKTVTRNGLTYKWPSYSTFTSEGKYVITVKDKAGNVSTITFTIDKTAPKITAKNASGTTITNGGSSTSAVTTTITETNLKSKTVTLNGKTYTWPTGNKFTTKGTYIITVLDYVGYKTTYKFTIK